MLEKINSPADIKLLRQEELEILAEDIRRVIIETCSKNGGHLAPSLGTVELTLALHYVFDAPRDKIIWDVGHQAYAHKLITGPPGPVPHTAQKRRRLRLPATRGEHLRRLQRGPQQHLDLGLRPGSRRRAASRAKTSRSSPSSATGP